MCTERFHRNDRPYDLPGAQLPKRYYIGCDGYTLSFANLNSSPLNNGFEWQFGDPGSSANNISNLENPTHIFRYRHFHHQTDREQGHFLCRFSHIACACLSGIQAGFRNNSPMCKDKPVQFTGYHLR